MTDVFAARSMAVLFQTTRPTVDRDDEPPFSPWRPKCRETMRTSKRPTRRDEEGLQRQCYMPKGRISVRRRIDAQKTNGKAS